MVRLTALLASLFIGAEGVRQWSNSNSSSTKDWNPKLLPGQIDVKRPAFLMLDEGKDRVLITQFGFNTKPDTWNPIRLPAQSSISQVPLSMLSEQVALGELSGDLADNHLVVKTSSPLQWPNKLSTTPAEFGDYIVVPDGFLPPGKDGGDLYFCTQDGQCTAITGSVPKTFYHEVEWHDFDGDGKKDILTARVKKEGLFGFTFKGEMVWLKNPGSSGFADSVWQETKIVDGPDVIFKSRPYKGGLAVFTTEFFENEYLAVHFLTLSGVHTGVKVIDDNMGKPFAVDIVDLDADGVDELIATNHQGPNDNILPAVFAYEVDWEDLENAAYDRHALTYGPSENKVNMIGVGAPGFAHGFYPQIGMAGPKWVYCAGDGAFDVWILKPLPGRFKYETTIIDINGTTGQILDHDFDGDGIIDLLIPDNDFWKLHVITFE